MSLAAIFKSGLTAISHNSDRNVLIHFSL